MTLFIFSVFFGGIVVWVYATHQTHHARMDNLNQQRLTQRARRARRTRQQGYMGTFRSLVDPRMASQAIDPVLTNLYGTDTTLNRFFRNWYESK